MLESAWSCGETARGLLAVMCSLSGQEELRRDPIHSADVGSIMAAQQLQPHGFRLDNIIKINPDVKI